MRSPHGTFKRPNHIKVWRPRRVVFSTGKPLSTSGIEADGAMESDCPVERPMMAGDYYMRSLHVSASPTGGVPSRTLPPFLPSFLPSYLSYFLLSFQYRSHQRKTNREKTKTNRSRIREHDSIRRVARINSAYSTPLAESGSFGQPLGRFLSKPQPTDLFHNRRFEVQQNAVCVGPTHLC